LQSIIKGRVVGVRNISVKKTGEAYMTSEETQVQDIRDRDVETAKEHV
jgi:hypothetical protein